MHKKMFKIIAYPLLLAFAYFSINNANAGPITVTENINPKSKQYLQLSEKQFIELKPTISISYNGNIQPEPSNVGIVSYRDDQPKDLELLIANNQQKNNDSKKESPSPSLKPATQHPGISLDPKHSIWGPSEPIKLIFEGTNDLESFLMALHTQRGREGFVYYDRSQIEDLSIGFRLFPFGDPYEFKLAGQVIAGDNTETRAVIEFTNRYFFQPPHGKFNKFRAGFNFFQIDGSELERSFYIYDRYEILKKLKIMGIIAYDQQNDLASSSKKDGLNFNGSLMYTIFPSHYVYGGLTHNFSEEKLTKVFGATKVAAQKFKSFYDQIAYLAQFRLKPDSKVALLGFMYGPDNQFIRFPGIGMSEAWNYGTALPSELKDLRIFENISNSTNTFDISKIAAFLFYMDQDLGGGMRLENTELEYFSSPILIMPEGKKDPTLRIYLGLNAAKSKMTGIPFMGTSVEDKLKLTAGFEKTVGRNMYGMNYSYIIECETGKPEEHKHVVFFTVVH